MSLIVTLAVEDLDHSELFYRGVLELPVERFRPEGSHHDVLMISQGDATVLLRESAVLEAQHPAAFQHLDRQNHGVGLSLDFQVGHLNIVRTNLNRQEHPCLYELEDQEHGFSELWVYDPDNYLIILTQVAQPSP
jgi:catechol 2,3-dioxygenase-like lactoylglutathione lyase family enzyme